MIDAADAVRQFMTGRQRADLDADRMLLFAVVRAVEVIGEAASKVSEETRAMAPGIPWGGIVSMRNRLIHGYFDIDTDIVWKTVTDELPALLPELRALVVPR
jgi:uncharacterized protein with HEPN domain